MERDFLSHAKNNNFMSLVIGKKRHISSNETLRLWQNRLTAKINVQLSNTDVNYLWF